MKANSKSICILIDPCADVDCNPGEECVAEGDTGVCKCGDLTADEGCFNGTCAGKSIMSGNRFVITCLLHNI